MRKVDELFERYGESHRNRTNKAIHWVCVPAIMWSVLAALWAASPMAAWAGVALATAFYLWLSLPIALGMLVVSVAMIYPLNSLGSDTFFVAAVVFVVAWIGQFIGHAIEGRKPSFVEDVRFFLVGPAWLLSDLYRRLGVRY